MSKKVRNREREKSNPGKKLNKKISRALNRRSRSTSDNPPLRSILMEKRADQFRKGPLDLDEKITIMAMAAKGDDPTVISAFLKRPATAIRLFIQKHRSTTGLARVVLESGAEKLARRIVNKANVEESLEVMDRLDILSTKREKSGDKNTQFNLIIGGGTPRETTVRTLPAVPTQEQIEAAGGE
jgi:hypothetical protein